MTSVLRVHFFPPVDSQIHICLAVVCVDVCCPVVWIVNRRPRPRHHHEILCVNETELVAGCRV